MLLATQRIRSHVVVSLAALLLGAGITLADQINWTAPGDGSFQDASNWSLPMAPGSNNLVVLDRPTAGTTIFFDDDDETLSLEMWEGTYVFDLGGHTYALTDIAAPLSLFGPGVYDLTVANGTLTSWSASVGASGAWRIAPGGSVQLTQGISLGSAGNCRLSVEGGAFSAVSAQIGFGPTSVAVLEVSDGGIATFGPLVLVLGSNRSATGQLIVCGAGSRLKGVTDLDCGLGGATVAITGDGEAEMDVVFLGGAATSVQTTVSTGGTWTITEELMVDDSTTQLTIKTGGLVDVGGVGTELTGGTITVQDGGTLRTTALERFGGALGLDAGSTVEITDQDVLIGPGGPFGRGLTINEGVEVIVQQSVTVSRPDAANNITIVGGAMHVGGDLVLGDGANEFGLLQLASVVGGSSTLDVGGRLWVGGVPNGAGGTGTVGLYGDDVLTADQINVRVNGTYDQQAGTTHASRLSSSGSFTQADGLLAIGNDPPPEITSGVVVNHVGDPIGGRVTFGGVTTTQGAWLATRVGGHAFLSVSGPWTCNGELVVGRTDGAIESAQIDVLDLLSVVGDVTLHEGTWMQLGFGGVVSATTIHNHGLLSGYGSLEADFMNHGRLDPSSTFFDFAGGEGVPGEITCDSTYEQTADGTLAIALESAAQYDRFVVGEDAQLAGTLEIELLGGYEPPVGEPFQIMDVGGTITGTFDVEPAGYDVIYLSSGVIVKRAEPCPADLDGTGAVGFNDLALLLGNWGPCDGDCPWDLDGSNHVGFNDLALLLGGWVRARWEAISRSSARTGTEADGPDRILRNFR